MIPKEYLEPTEWKDEDYDYSEDFDEEEEYEEEGDEWDDHGFSDCEDYYRYRL